MDEITIFNSYSQIQGSYRRWVESKLQEYGEENGILS